MYPGWSGIHCVLRLSLNSWQPSFLSLPNSGITIGSHHIILCVIFLPEGNNLFAIVGHFCSIKLKCVILLYLLLFLAEQDIFIRACVYVYIFNMNIPKIL